MAYQNWVTLLVVRSVGVAGCATGTYSGLGRGKTAQVSTYAGDRSEAILKTNREAERYCKEHGGGFVRVVREETVYQGQLDERVGATAQALSRVASAIGNAQAGQAGAAVASPTDYKTTVEFVCQ